MSQVTRLQNSEPARKQCNDCHEWFKKTAFPPGRARCRECHKERQKVSSWKSHLKRKYGITPEIHQEMYEDQGGKCYFCDCHRPSRHRPNRGENGLVIDHNKDNKDTKIVRGLLCHLCNANWIDQYKDLPEEYRDSPRANAYLRRGETGDYVESIKLRLASHPASQLTAASS